MAQSNSTIYETLRSGSASHIRLDGSLGAILIAAIFASILFGIAVVQIFIYYQNSPDDPKYMKWAVAFLWFLDAFHLALIVHVVYTYLVTDFGDFNAITRIGWSHDLQIIITDFSDTIVSMIYIYRVWFVSNKSCLLTIGALLLNLAAFVAGMIFGIKTFTFEVFSDIAAIRWVGYISLGSAAASDFWCAISLCYFLARDRTGFKATDTKLSILMMYIIGTGLLTSVCSLACVILMATLPHALVFIAVFFCLPKLYFNSLLAMLNARNYLRRGVPSRSTGHGAYQLSKMVDISHISRPTATDAEASFEMVHMSSDKLAGSDYKV